MRAAGRAEGPPNRRHVIHGVLADIDILKRAETERSHLLRRLASAQEEEQRRISRELHDQIGQTVTGLSLGLKALEQGLAKGSNGEAATEQVRWLEQLAAQIGRDIHRTASDLRPTAIDDLGIFKAIEAYVADWQERYGVRVDIQTFGRDDSLPADAAAVLYRLVQEGLTNVLKHASASKVSIVLEKKPEGLALVLEDDGIGFDPENVGRMASGAGRTSGLGLSGMKERVALLGGTIAMESAAGKGSTIFVQIPLEAPEAVSMTPVRIALVDDHPVVLAGIRALLQGVPEVELVGEASTGATGLKAICDCSPDIAVIDLSLPDISGMELARQVTRRCPDVKIIALTVHEDRAYVHPVLEAGARGYLLKRSAGDELLRAIRDVNQGAIYLDPAIAEKAATSAPECVAGRGRRRRTQPARRGRAQARGAGLQQQANRRTARSERQERRDLQGAGLREKGIAQPRGYRPLWHQAGLAHRQIERGELRRCIFGYLACPERGIPRRSLDRHAALLPPLIARCALHFQDLAGRTGAIIDVDRGVGVHHQRFVGINLLGRGWLRREQRQQQRARANQSAQDAPRYRNARRRSECEGSTRRRHFIGPFSPGTSRPMRESVAICCE